MQKTNKQKTEKIVMSALMTTLVIIFQLLATYTTFFGPFSTAIGLIPIAIGACLCGPAIGAWLGFVFGVVVIAYSKHCVISLVFLRRRSKTRVF